MQTSSPATSIAKTYWNGFQLRHEFRFLPSGDLARIFTASVVSNTTEFIGDENGKPRGIVGMVGTPTYMPVNNLAEMLGEQVTRADGSVVDVNTLLIDILDKALPGMLDQYATTIVGNPGTVTNIPQPEPLTLVIP